MFLYTFALVKRIVAPFLAILILLSSTGLTYSTHFCMGRAVDHVVKMGVHDLDCGMANMDKACSSDEMALDVPTCCDNEHVFVDIDDEFKVVNPETKFNAKFIVAFTYSFLLENLTIEEPALAFADHSPPPLGHDYQSMYQTFLL
jgi:hypothetical protein